MKNYTLMQFRNLKSGLAEKGRTTLNDILELTGSEISFNFVPTGGFTPFVHSHKNNEEVCIVLFGNGKLMVDDDEIDITEGDVFKISPNGERAIKAVSDLGFTCIQTKENSLINETKHDGIIKKRKASWI